MTSTTRLFTNVGIVAMVAILFAGCSLLPGKTTVENKVMVEDESYTELSPDDSMESIESDLDATVIEDEDFTELETELEVDLSN